MPAPRTKKQWYWLHRQQCGPCGGYARAEAPGAVGQSPFGVHLHALVVLWVGRFRQSQRLVAEQGEVLFGLSISPGTVAAMEKRVAAALAEPVEETRAAIRQAAVLHQDETGWRMLKRKAWFPGGGLASGCDSEAGTRFVERVLTGWATLRLQERDLFDYLCRAIHTHCSGQPAPSILPRASITWPVTIIVITHRLVESETSVAHLHAPTSSAIA